MSKAIKSLEVTGTFSEIESAESINELANECDFAVVQLGQHQVTLLTDRGLQRAQKAEVGTNFKMRTASHGYRLIVRVDGKSLGFTEEYTAPSNLPKRLPGFRHAWIDVIGAGFVEKILAWESARQTLVVDGYK